MQQGFLGDESSAQQIFTKSTPELKQTQINHSHVHTKSKLVHQWRGRSEKASQGHKICNGANNLDLGVEGAIYSYNIISTHWRQRFYFLEIFEVFPKISDNHQRNNFQDFLHYFQNFLKNSSMSKAQTGQIAFPNNLKIFFKKIQKYYYRNLQSQHSLKIFTVASEFATILSEFFELWNSNTSTAENWAKLHFGKFWKH